MERIPFNSLPQGLYAAMNAVQNHINNSGLDKTLLELIYTRVSQINGCAYCLDMHSKDAIEAGETIQRLISVSAWRDTPYYSGPERAALAFAERLTIISVDEENNDIHDELISFFNKAEIANLSLAIAQINSWNRLMKSFGSIAGSHNPTKNH